MLMPTKDLLHKDNKDSFYKIQQFIPNTKTQSFNIYKVTERCVVKFTRMLVGEVKVYFYEPEKNKRTDVSSELGRIKSNIEEWKIIVQVDRITFMSKAVINWLYGQYIYETMLKDLSGIFYYISNYGVYTAKQELIKPQYLLMREVLTSSDKVFYFINNEMHGRDEVRDFRSGKFIDFTKIHKTRNIFNEAVGNGYEAYIGKKYEELGYEVEYNGMKKGVNDGGIDLICKKDKNMTFVQCKNWTIHKYKVNQKDLRAFVGDVQLFLMEDIKNYSDIAYHFIISDEKILTDNAKNFLKKYKFLKWKIQGM